MRLTYKIAKEHPLSLTVSCEGTVIGAIKHENDGYRYWPKTAGKKYSGELFSSLNKCKQSIEQD